MGVSLHKTHRKLNLRKMIFVIIPLIALSTWWFKDVRYYQESTKVDSKYILRGKVFGAAYVVSSNPWYSPTNSYRYLTKHRHVVFYRRLKFGSTDYRLSIFEFHPEAIWGDSSPW